MADFEVHPVGTVRGLLQYISELEQRLIADNPQDPIEVNSPSAIPEDQAPDDVPAFLKKQAD